MEQRRSRSIAGAEPGRARVLSPWALLGSVITIVATLYLLYPRQSLIEQVQRSSDNDRLTADYVTALLRTEPGNLELRMLLAEKRHALGQMALAREAMEPVMLSGDPGLRRRMLLLELRILQSEVLAQAPDTAAWAHSQAQMRQRLADYLKEDWPPRQLLEFAQLARSLRLRELSLAYEQRLVRSPAAVPAEWLAQAALQALGEGEYAQSARLYFAAQKRATERDDKRRYFLTALATLRSGNLLREALDAADAEIGELREDEETLAYLTRLALAAGDPGRAQVYVKRLMRLSLASPSPVQGVWAARLLDRVLDLVLTSAHAAEAPGPAPGAATPATMRPYDEQMYTLAYEVFLANGNVSDAARVAGAAVAQRPDDLAWRRRLAQSSEWSGHPAEALKQWRHLAERGGSDEAWSAILRLAPGLQDDEALLVAWTREAGRRALSTEEWKRVAGIYEALGRPADGIAFLKRQFEQHRDLAMLEIASELEERSGRSDEAIASLRRIMSLGGDDMAHALRLSTLLFLRSDFAGAYAVLQPMQARADTQDKVYWKLLADLAWQMQDDAVAASAYDRLQSGGQADSNDLERLVVLLRPQQPAEARRMALFSWRKFRSVSGFLLALELANEQRDYPGMKALMDEAQPGDEARLAANAYYFMLRASYFQASGDRRKAMDEYRRAMAVPGNADNADLRLSYLWLLIDSRQDTEMSRELRERLRAWGGSTQPAWWDAYAAAWLALGEPRRALPWMSRQAAAHAGDYLWLANYAETLEEAGQVGMAARVRRHAWLQARQRMQEQPALAQGRESMLAYARLALRNAPGDASLNAMRRLLRQDTPQPAAAAATAAPQALPANELAMDKAVSELVLAWALGEQHIDAARRFMWLRFARRVEAPAWADIGLALVERDRDRLAAILDEDTREFPAAARIDAARELGRTQLAQTLGFEAQQRQPDSDDIHLRLATDLLASAGSIIARDTLFQRGAVQGHEESLRLQAWATPRLRLAIELGLMHQHSADGGQLAGVPGTDRTLAFSALWRHDRGETEFSIAARSGLASFTSLKLAHARPLVERISGNLALSLRERATESVALGLGGHKNEASASLNYRLSGREYLSGRLWSARFHTQQEAYLGLGRGLSAEAGYRIRSEYPDISIRLSRLVSHFQTAASGGVTDVAASLLPGAPASAPAAFFMPQSFRMWGINAGFGTDIREQRSRALRPFADVGRTVSSTSGSGYNWLLGAGGSVIGPDHLALYWMRAKGGGIGAAVRELGLRYQLFLD